MRLNIKAIALFFTIVCVMSSCLNDNTTEVTVYNDTALSSVTLGTLKCYYHTKSKSGADSVYSGSISGSNFPIHIDQLKHEAYNVDSLPLGTDMAHVLINIGTKNNGIPVIKSLTSDSIFSISSTDSLDFSQPREIYVYSQSGIYSQKYTVTLSAHKEAADSFRWSRLADNARIASYAKVKAVAFNKAMYLLGASTTGSELLKTAATDGNRWSEVTLPVSLSASASLIAGSGTIYVADNETIYASTDGSSWISTPASGVQQLVGVCADEVYALSIDGEMLVSFDAGKTWHVDAKDSDKAYLPSQDISSIAYVMPTNKDVHRILMIGNRDASMNPTDTASVVWSKVVESDKSKSQSWAYQEFESINYHQLPCLSNLSVTQYASGILAIGGKGIASSKNAGFTQMYYSFDSGITWKSDSRFVLPKDFSATTATMASDDDNFLWIISTGSGQVWRGRLNKLGWKRDPGYIGK